MADTQQENFVIQTPAAVAQTEAGAHTLADARAGVELGAADAYGMAGESKSQARLVLSRFLHQRLAIIGLCTFAALGIASVLVGHFWQYSYTDITNNLNSPPSATNPFGTNAIGNDMFAQVMAGVEKDIQIALTVAVMATLIGVTIGAIAGYYRGWIDSALMRFVILETTLSYLGLGVQPPGVSLGLLVNQGQDSATTEWWLFVFPVVFLIVLILSIFLIGDGLREAFDPKKSRVRA